MAVILFQIINRVTSQDPAITMIKTKYGNAIRSRDHYFDYIFVLNLFVRNAFKGL